MGYPDTNEVSIGENNSSLLIPNWTSGVYAELCQAAFTPTGHSKASGASFGEKPLFCLGNFFH